MLQYNEVNYKEILKTLKPKSIKHRGINYYNIASAIDIETTSTLTSENEKFAFMYIWMMGIGHNEDIVYGRTWDEFTSALNDVKEVLNVDLDNRLVIYIHNLGYEFQFISKYFEWENVFAVSERKPINALTKCGIEFRDSYILSGYSLEDTAKNIVKHKVEKLTGSLDYEVVRHSSTHLTDEELSYCENDIKVVTAYIDEQIDIYQTIGKIPMTNTGRVRNYVTKNCYNTVSKSGRKRSTFKQYRKIMDDLTLDATTYTQLKRGFMGGFTHANANYVDETLADVSSIDLTSSYPSVMLSERFPMSRFKPITIKDESELFIYSKKYALLFDVKFTGLRSIITQDSYLSSSKCIKVENPTINNGRVSHADELVTTITNVDFDIISKVYEWDSISIANAKFAHLGYLPKPILESVLKLYQDKTELKGVEGHETEYLLSKGMLNSVYGMCVTDIVKGQTSIDSDGSWFNKSADLDEKLDQYNKSKKRVLYYPWGLWITAYARRNLWTGIMALGDDYVYSDTDSLKFKNYEKHTDYIEWFNNLMTTKIEVVCEQNRLDKSLVYPKTKTGEVKPLGVWEFEGTFNRFKTLGAKRYMDEQNGNVTITVSGLSKQQAVSYMMRRCNDDLDEVFKMFNENLYIPAEETGKNTHSYIDKPMSRTIKDYNGVEQLVESLSGVHLEKTSFTIERNRIFEEFLSNLSKGYIYRGLKHV